MTKLTRTFHPVGQGAFYTEKHTNPQTQETFNIVYDCGTMTRSVDINKIIDETFTKQDIIDILFISHFHKDHISGIFHLKDRCAKIKRVVIPLIPKEDRLLFVHSRRELSEYKELIINPEEFFGSETQITEIISIKQEEEQKNYLTRNQNNILVSGTHIPLNPHSVKNRWCFIPFNYDYTNSLNTLKDILIKQGLDYTKLTYISYIKENEKKIRDAYNKLPEGINSNSLVLYSGILFNKEHQFLKQIFIYHKAINWRVFSVHNCLYLGDSNTNKPADFLEQLSNKLTPMYYNSILTVQIPHHGSKPNFNKAIIQNPQKRVAVVSHGIGNRYKHPSPDVVKDITSEGILICSVTEESSSICIQKGKY